MHRTDFSSCFVEFARAVGVNTSLNTLGLQSCRLSNSDILTLTNELKDNSSLSFLELACENFFGSFVLAPYTCV